MIGSLLKIAFLSQLIIGSGDANGGSGTYIFPQDNDDISLSKHSNIVDRAASQTPSVTKSSLSLLKGVARPGSGEDDGTRTTDNCSYPLEILILQDSTASFQDDLDEMVNSQLDLMMEGLAASHPGSKVGVVSFRDKPIRPFGEPGENNVEKDWCWKPLMNGTFTDDVNVLKEAYKSFDASGGDDFPESQFYAIYGAMQSTELGWGQVANAQQLIVVATDSAPHYDGDGNDKQNMSAFSGSFDSADPEGQCVGEFYPTPQQAVDVTFTPVYNTSRLPFLAFLVFDGNYPKPNYTTNAWRWYTGAIGENPDTFVNDLASNSSNFWTELSEVIETINQAACTVKTTTSQPSSSTSSSESTTFQIWSDPPPSSASSSSSSSTSSESTTFQIWSDPEPSTSSSSTATSSSEIETTYESSSASSRYSSSSSMKIYSDPFPSTSTQGTTPPPTTTATKTQVISSVENSSTLIPSSRTSSLRGSSTMLPCPRCHCCHQENCGCACREELNKFVTVLPDDIAGAHIVIKFDH